MERDGQLFTDSYDIVHEGQLLLGDVQCCAVRAQEIVTESWDCMGTWPGG